MHPEFLSEGMQVLREYIHFCCFDFIEACKQYDKQGDGSIPERFLREALLTELTTTQIYFTETDVAQIIKESPINTQTRYIDYRELNRVLSKSVVPPTSFHIYRNAIAKQKINIPKSKEKALQEEIVRLFQEETSNYFDRKLHYDLKHLQLNDLDIELLASSSQNIIFDNPLQEKVARFQQLNNSIILENLQIIVAKKMAINALPQVASMFIAPEKLEVALLDYLGARKGQKLFPIILKEQFMQMLKVKLYNIPLNGDEMSLLYWLIWRRYNFCEFTLKSLVKWVIEMRGISTREVIKLYDKSNPNAEVIHLPKIYKELREVGQKYSPGVLEEAFKTFSTPDGQVNLENLKIVLRSLEIAHQQMDFNDFRFYCAKQGLFTMNKQQQVMLKVKELIESLCPSEVMPAVLEKSDVEKAYTTLFSSMMAALIDNINQRALKFVQAEQMIEEIRLRMIIAEELHTVDQHSLTIVIRSLQHNIEPSIAKPIREVYLAEFIDTLKRRFVVNIELPTDPLSVNYVPPKQTVHIEEPITQEDGQFVGEPKQAFAVTKLDERGVLDRMRKGLESYFHINSGSQYARAEQSCQQLLNYIQQFDPTKEGVIGKEVLFEIFQELLGFTHSELNQLVDFSMGVANVDKHSVSYTFLCLQLSQYYQTSQLISTLRKI